MRIPIVYIAGSGRTGSTLLSLLLSQGPDTKNVGQTRDLAKAVSREARCTCGEPVVSCSFWSRIVTENRLSDPGAAERVNDLRKDFIKSDPWEEIAGKVPHPYVEYLRELYGSVGRAAPGKVLIDSSKTPEIALGLSRIPEFDLTVIHLMRDPRAVACSWYRKLGDRRRTVGLLKTWRQRTRVMNAWESRDSSAVISIRYEEFAARPRKAIADIRDRASLPDIPGLFAGDDTAVISWEDQHLFPPANESVLARKETRVVIRPALEWRKARHLGLHLTALRHTFPEGLRYCLRSRSSAAPGQ